MFEIEQIVSHKYDSNAMTMTLECQWKGFSPEENTWEPLQSIYEDAPLVVKDYLRRLPKAEVEKIRQCLDI